MLVEDDARVRLALARVLAARWDVRATASAEEATDHLGDPGLVAVVADLELTGRDGLWLLARTRERAPGVLRVLITGHRALEVWRRPEAELVHWFIEKPVSPRELLAALETALQSSS